jgi:DNA-binding NarL/FixJ family response regulator
MRTRILLADDHSMLLEAFRALLEPEFEVVGTATDGRMLIEEFSRLKPDIVVIDVGMPLLNGLDAGRQLKALQRSVKLIYLTMNPEPDLAREALRLGASGYVLKSSAASELKQAIHEALKGRSYVTPLITQDVVGLLLEQREGAHELTTRQREVLQLLAEGRSMKEVASILDVTPRTVAELVQYAVKHGIVI